MWIKCCQSECGGLETDLEPVGQYEVNQHHLVLAKTTQEGGLSLQTWRCCTHVQPVQSAAAFQRNTHTHRLKVDKTNWHIPVLFPECSCEILLSHLTAADEWPERNVSGPVNTQTLIRCRYNGRKGSVFNWLHSPPPPSLLKWLNGGGWWCLLVQIEANVSNYRDFFLTMPSLDWYFSGFYYFDWMASYYCCLYLQHLHTRILPDPFCRDLLTAFRMLLNSFSCGKKSTSIQLHYFCLNN